jgi:hypothetical protein
LDEAKVLAIKNEWWGNKWGTNYEHYTI